jgi:hypothetical protein
VATSTMPAAALRRVARLDAMVTLRAPSTGCSANCSFARRAERSRYPGREDELDLDMRSRMLPTRDPRAARAAGSDLPELGRARGIAESIGDRTAWLVWHRARHQEQRDRTEVKRHRRRFGDGG